MDIAGTTLVITGAGNGIGAAIAERFAGRGARVLVGDLNAAAAEAVAARIRASGGIAIPQRADVSVEADIQALVARAEAELGPVDIICSNAGINQDGGAEAPDEIWNRAWSINVMAHVHAARAVLPGMLARQRGYILNNCSAAGLLTAPGAASYAATKHAAVAFAEWLAVTHGDQGIRVSAICPQAVRTQMLAESVSSGNAATRELAKIGRTLDPDEVAACVEDGVRAEQFLILPHPEVAEMHRRKAENPDRWLAGMRRFVGSIGKTQN
ncbi:SDR family oxidoreductase [Gemmobacter sp.]|uniref:SDR family oxidoreductase n=1 Tax=Gemmobacter sp. TaxID=1898957 RepID=UPI002AFF2CC0|nr:SDR family oxidoreductase [Gemmobacter sp.]